MIFAEMREEGLYLCHLIAIFMVATGDTGGKQLFHVEK